MTKCHMLRHILDVLTLQVLQSWLYNRASLANHSPLLIVSQSQDHIYKVLLDHHQVLCIECLMASSLYERPIFFLFLSNNFIVSSYVDEFRIDVQIEVSIQKVCHIYTFQDYTYSVLMEIMHHTCNSVNDFGSFPFGEISSL